MITAERNIRLVAHVIRSAYPLAQLKDGVAVRKQNAARDETVAKLSFCNLHSEPFFVPVNVNFAICHSGYHFPLRVLFGGAGLH